MRPLFLKLKDTAKTSMNTHGSKGGGSDGSRAPLENENLIKFHKYASPPPPGKHDYPLDPHPTPEKCSGSAHDEDIALQLKNMNDNVK